MTVDSRTGCIASAGTPKAFKIQAQYPAGAQPTCTAEAEERDRRDRDRGDDDEVEEPSEEPPSGGSDDDGGTVPSVLGYTRPAAENILRREGFRVNVVYEAESDSGQAKRRRGRVWKQSPGGGDSAPEGSAVTIWVNP